jgi:hypothetical protein
MRIAGRILLSRPPGRDGRRAARVIRDAASLCMLIAGAVLAPVTVESGRARADGVPVSSPGATTILTHYESFVLNNCTPCVRETYPIATLPVAATKTPDFPRRAGMPATTTRAGEVAVELLRAYPLGRTNQQHLAMRVALSVATGLQGQTYSLGTALVDEADVPQLAGMIGEMANATAPAHSRAEMSDLEFHGDTMRIGIVRLRDETVAYIQAWSSSDLPRLALKQVWEVPSLYLPVSDLAQLRHAVEQAGGKIRELRSQ